MQPTDPSAFDRLLIAVGVTLTWLGGEAGKAMIAGAAGGLYRWLMAERRWRCWPHGRCVEPANHRRRAGRAP